MKTFDIVSGKYALNRRQSIFVSRYNATDKKEDINIWCQQDDYHKSWVLLAKYCAHTGEILRGYEAVPAEIVELVKTLQD